jgi:signal transduction histidine kinase
MKIWQRGALLISLPIIIDGFGLILMYDAVVKSQAALQYERKQVLLMQAVNQLFSSFVGSAGLLASAAMSDDPSREKKGLTVLRDSRAQLAKVRQLCADDTNMSAMAESLEQKGFVPLEQFMAEQQNAETSVHGLVAFKRVRRAFQQAGRANDICLRLVDYQNHEHDEALRRQSETAKNLYHILFGLAAINIVGGVLALTVFYQSVAKRVRALVSKAERLPTLSDSGERLKGDDEFVQIDSSLHNAMDRLIEAKKFRANLISMVAHELRSPLTSIGIAAELLVHSPKSQLNEHSKERVGRIGANVDHLIKVINEFLEVEKMQSSELIMHFEPVQTLSLIGETFDSLSELAAAKQVRLVKTGADTVITTDRQKTTQVLINLVSNAIKFSPADAEVVVDVSEENDLARFEIRDHGPGVPPELQDRVFIKFAQASAPDNAKGSSGLGLFVSKMFIESQGGNLGYTAGDQGSTFWFTLPAQR